MRYLIVLLIAQAALAEDFCEPYNEALAGLRNRGASAKKALDAKFVAPPAPAEKFDSQWFAQEFSDFVLPMPSEPTKKNVKRESNGSLSINIPKVFVAEMAGDTLLQDGSMSDEAAEELEEYWERKKIKASDYSLNLHLLSPSFLACDDIKSPADLQIKTKLATIKSIGGVFDESRPVTRLHFKDAKMILLSGEHATDKNRFVVQLFTEKEDKTSRHLTFFFWNKADVEKFVSYAANMRDKNFFKKTAK